VWGRVSVLWHWKKLEYTPDRQIGVVVCCTATHGNSLQHATTRCNTLQHTATHCNTLQHTATHCNTLHQNITCNTTMAGDTFKPGTCSPGGHGYAVNADTWQRSDRVPYLANNKFWEPGVRRVRRSWAFWRLDLLDRHKRGFPNQWPCPAEEMMCWVSYISSIERKFVKNLNLGVVSFLFHARTHARTHTRIRWHTHFDGILVPVRFDPGTYRSSVNTLTDRRKLHWDSNEVFVYRVVPGHRNWQIEPVGWNWAGFFTEGLETRWQRFGQFLYIF